MLSWAAQYYLGQHMWYIMNILKYLYLIWYSKTISFNFLPKTSSCLISNTTPLLFVIYFKIFPWISFLAYLLPRVPLGLHKRHYFIYLHATMEKRIMLSLCLCFILLFIYSPSFSHVFFLITNAAFLINTEKWGFGNTCMYVDLLN